jgi:hypothetical protein
MHPKESSKKVETVNGSRAIAEKTAPFFSKYYERFKAIVQKRPKLTLVFMLLFASLNFVLMVYLVNRKPAPTLLPKGLNANPFSIPGKNNGASFSIPNYLKISKLKDSLNYIMKKPQLSKKDSLLFIRICEEYSKLDPAFFQEVNKSVHKNLKPSNHETKPHD